MLHRIRVLLLLIVLMGILVPFSVLQIQVVTSASVVHVSPLVATVPLQKCRPDYC
jgi:hypothetical protein